MALQAETLERKSEFEQEILKRIMALVDKLREAESDVKKIKSELDSAKDLVPWAFDKDGNVQGTEAPIRVG